MRPNRSLQLLALATTATLTGGLALAGGPSPCSPDVLSVSPTESTVYTIELEGDLAVCAASDAIDIYDVSSPTNPVLLGSWFNNQGLDHVSVDGDLALVGAKSWGVYVLDLSDPTQPVPIANIPPGEGNWTLDVVLDGTVGHFGVFPAPQMGSGKGQTLGVVATYDFSDPANPEPMSSLDHPSPHHFCLDGDRLFVGGEDAFSVLDVSDPYAVTTLGTVVGDPMLAAISEIEVIGDRAYVSRYIDSATVVDVSDPSAPVPTAQFGDFALGIYARGSTLVLPGWDFTGGTKIYDISMPDAPVQFAAITSIGSTYCATSDGEVFYLGEFEAEMTVLDTSPCDGSPFTSFCDSSDEALDQCPCANPGSQGAGCDNPQGTGGVRLAVLAQETGVLNRATLEGSGFPTSATPTAIVIRADTLEQNRVAFGDGLRCVGVPIVRLAPSFADGGVSTHVIGHGAMAGSGSFYYQLWYRSTPAMFCTPDAFNLSNGRTIPW